MGASVIHIRVKPATEPDGLHAVGEEELRDYLSPSKSPFIQWYDTIETSTDSVQVLDLAIPAFLAAVPDFKKMLNPSAWQRRLDDVLAEASGALGVLPQEVDLWDWVPAEGDAEREVIRQRLVTLFKATTGGGNGAIPQYGAAACTKMLHRKRPRLLPIIDSGIYRAWFDKNSSSWRTDEMADIVLKVADEMRPPERQRELDLAAEIARELWPNVELTKLRIYDIVSYHVFRELGPQ